MAERIAGYGMVIVLSYIGRGKQFADTGIPVSAGNYALSTPTENRLAGRFTRNTVGPLKVTPGILGEDITAKAVQPEELFWYSTETATSEEIAPAGVTRNNVIVSPEASVTELEVAAAVPAARIEVAIINLSWCY